MSLMSSLNTGLSGLKVSQSALTTAAHNIANADTKGYVRQQVVITDYSYTSTVGHRNNLKQVGLGANVACVRQVRDMFLDKKYREEFGRQSFYETQYAATTEVEDLFGEMEGEQFSKMITGMWESLQEMAKVPDSTVSRDLFVSSVSMFLERCQVVQKQLDEYQAGLNTQIMSEVKTINEITKEINKLNKSIIEYEAGGVESANDLRDTRNLLLDRLAGHLKISVNEQASGAVEIYAEGAPLLLADICFTMGVEQMEPGSNLLKPVWLNNGCGDVFDGKNIAYATANDTDIGSLRAIITARGSKIADYTDIPIKPLESDYTDAGGNLDTAAYKAAFMDFEAQVEKYNQTVSPSLIMKTQAQFDQLIHGIVTAINDILSPRIEIELEGGEKIWVLDEANAPIGCDADKTMGTELFSRNTVARYTEREVLLPGATDKIKVKVYNGEDPNNPHSLYSIRQISVNSELLQYSSKLPVIENPSSGYEGGYNAVMIEKLLATYDKEFATLDPNSLTSNTFQDYYTAMIGNLGTQGKIWEGISNNQRELLNTIENKRQSLTGVSTDEEMVDLIKFQHAYNASSRYLTVIDEMLEHLIMRLG